jgi:hypothetical protein
MSATDGPSSIVLQGDSLASALQFVDQAGSGIKEEFAEMIHAEDPEAVPDAWLGAAATSGSFDLTALRRWSEGRSATQIRRAGPTRLSLDLGLRKAILADLGSREDILAAAESGPGPADYLRSVLVGMLKDSLPDLDEMSRTQLAAVAICRSWLDGIVPDLVPTNELRARLARADLVRPFERLLAHGFVGRESELGRLADYVGVTPSGSWKNRLVSLGRFIAPSIFTDPPLLIHGPGGIGKSTLVAKFVLDQLAAPAAEKMTFVYLDFDRPSLRNTDPKPMFLEILHQIGLQHPHLEFMLQDIASSISQSRQAQEALESFSTNEFEWAIQRLAETLHGSLPEVPPVLLVLDTFEEIQFLGSDVVASYLAALDIFYGRLSQLRLIISGRATIDREMIETASLPLTGFDAAAGKQFLRQYIAQHPSLEARRRGSVISEELIHSVSRVAGGTPLTLSLAGENLVRAAERGHVNEPAEILRIVKSTRADRVQQGLYGRILEHLHNSQLAVIAYPGLILRRIDGDVIREVLAPACRLRLHSSEEADNLLKALRQEMSLIEPEDIGPGIRHRADVRRLMLDEIESGARSKARRIERRAIAFYRRRSDENGRPEDRAEEIYHMMRLEYDLARLEARWMDGVGPLLASAVDEVPQRQRVWLLQKLDAGLELSDVANADQPLWEEVVERRARRLLSSGRIKEALAEILSREPHAWLPSGPMFLLAAEIYAADQDYSSAIDMAYEAAFGAEARGNVDGKANALIFVAAVHEAHWQGSQALEALARIEPDRSLLSRESEIRFLAARTRLLGQSGQNAETVKELQGAALALLDRPMINTLRRRPALLREVAGTFGGVQPLLIKEALNVIGLDLLDHQSINLALRAISRWDEEVAGSPLAGDPGDILEELQERPILAGLGGGERGLLDVEAWLTDNRGAAAKAVARLWNRYPVSAAVAERFALLYREASIRAVRREANYA